MDRHSHGPEAALPPESVLEECDSLPQRLLAQAEAEGRESLIGVSLENDDGSRLVVRDFAVKLEYVETDHVWAGLTGNLIGTGLFFGRGLLWERRRRMIVGPKLPDSRWPDGKLWPFEERIPYDVHDEVPTLRIDEYDADDNLTGVRMVGVPSLDNKFQRGPEAEPTSTIEIDVPTDKGQKPADASLIFDLITETQRKHELYDWSGLKYSLRGQEVTIDREVWIRKRTLGGWKNQRSFVVKRVGDDGLQFWDTITVNSLKQELDGLNRQRVKNPDPGITDNYGRSERRDLKLRFEVPPVPRSIIPERHLGQMTLQLHETLDPATKEARGLQADQAFNMLCGADIYKGRRLENQKAIMLAIPETEYYVASLIKTSQRIGTGRLLSLAAQVRDMYIRERKKIGLEPTDDDESISWVLLALAEQEVAHGPVIGNSGDYGRSDRDKQRELVAYRVGEVFDKATVRRRQDDPRMAIERLPNGAVKMKDEKVVDESGAVTGTRRMPVQRMVMPWQVEHDDQAIRELDKVIRNEIDRELKKITPHNLQLTYPQHVKIGRLLSGQ
jgi:hypothetical protein